MRKIKDILRLHYEAHLSHRAIARSINVGYGTVADYLKRAQQAGVTWPLPEGMQERDLGRLLFPTQALTGQRRFAEPDYPTVDPRGIGLRRKTRLVGRPGNHLPAE